MGIQAMWNSLNTNVKLILQLNKYYYEGTKNCQIVEDCNCVGPMLDLYLPKLARLIKQNVRTL